MNSQRWETASYGKLSPKTVSVLFGIPAEAKERGRNGSVNGDAVENPKTSLSRNDWGRVKFATISIQEMFSQFVNEDHWDSKEETREREASGFKKQEACD